MVRQALTFYEFLNESMLDQGSQYRYASGFEGAARDPMQHALPLMGVGGTVGGPWKAWSVV